MENKYFYLSKKYAKENGIWIYKESISPIENYKEEFGEDAYEYIGKTIPNCPWYDEKTDSIIEMPRNIRVIKGMEKLNSGEYINENNEIVSVNKPENMIKPLWNPNENVWRESIDDESVTKETLDDLKKNFFKYFEAYKKLTELSKFGLVEFGDEKNKECLNFLDKFNPNKSNINLRELIEIEKTIPEILKQYI